LMTSRNKMKPVTGKVLFDCGFRMAKADARFYSPSCA
jgi:hypothetical protein